MSISEASRHLSKGFVKALHARFRCCVLCNSCSMRKSSKQGSLQAGPQSHRPIGSTEGTDVYNTPATDTCSLFDNSPIDAATMSGVCESKQASKQGVQLGGFTSRTQRLIVLVQAQQSRQPPWLALDAFTPAALAQPQQCLKASRQHEYQREVIKAW